MAMKNENDEEISSGNGKKAWKPVNSRNGK